MSTVLAAIDNSAAASQVLAAAAAIGHSLGWEVEALHVRQDGHVGARAAAAAAGVELTEVEGSPIEAISGRAARDEVVALVVGTRDFPAADVLGSTSLELVTALAKPIVLVPPDATPMSSFRRILIPLDPSAADEDALRRGLNLLCAAEIEVVVLHVGFAESLPMFEDQPQHETDSWMAEFLTRYCPVAPQGIRFELRTGRPGERVVDVAAETGADLVALGWKRDLTPGRASVVREVLARATTPVVLFPLLPAAGAGGASRRRTGASI
jgi:nucleotide-binding universal stress UspA family protein